MERKQEIKLGEFDMVQRDGLRDFTKLDVWKKAHEASHQVHDWTTGKAFRGSYSYRDQVERASLSVPTNIVEGCSCLHEKEFAQFLNIARRSAGETRYLLLFGFERKYLDSIMFDPLGHTYLEIQLCWGV